jgi:diguanylate cyclase (GGDEF)-like protein
MCVDPDWEPYEKIDKNGEYSGIAADLVRTIADRSGVSLSLVVTKNWDESIEFSKSGRCDILAFLNQTEKRDEWLLFTEPYFIDRNVFITRSQHDYISDLAEISGETAVLPRGTSIEERLRRDYPNIRIITVESEAEALGMVENRQADMTLRSLTMAAYTIKNEGWFNLKIAGEIPAYANSFRIGVSKSRPELRDALNHGIAALEPTELKDAVNRHISITVERFIDYGLLIKTILASLAVIAAVFFAMLYFRRQNRRLRTLSVRLEEELSKQERARAEIQHLANHDMLTGLPNRMLLMDRLEQAVALAKRDGLKIGLLFIDLDKFKPVNDMHGHAVGDLLLISVAERLRQQVRASDTVARLGGDEFVIIMNNINDRSAVERMAETVCGVLSQEVSLNGIVISIQASIGIAVFPEDGRDTDGLLSHADREMYIMKHSNLQGHAVSPANTHP